MPEFREFKQVVLQSAKDTEFDVATGDFGNLVVQPAEDFYYFYDTAERRLIKSFVLRDGPQVDTMCDVVVIEKDGEMEPRLHFWKKDKTRGNVGKDAYEAIRANESAVLVKASVDVANTHQNLWKLIAFLQSVQDLSLPQHQFRVADASDAELLEALEGHDKESVLTAVKTYIGNDLTEQDVHMLVDRRRALEHFERLINEAGFIESERDRLGLRGVEAVWQDFFEANPWIFGYGLTLVSCEAVSEKGLEAVTTGHNVFSGGGKRIDAAMRTRGFIQSLLFAEIKRHDTDLLRSEPYRPPDVYQASKQLAGAVAQVQKTAHKAVKALQDLHRQRTPEGDFEYDVSTVMPRQVVILGHLSELTSGDDVNVEKMTSFELFRRSQLDVDILTFDEVLERTRFIVESGEEMAAAQLPGHGDTKA